MYKMQLFRLMLSQQQLQWLLGVLIIPLIPLFSVLVWLLFQKHLFRVNYCADKKQSRIIKRQWQKGFSIPIQTIPQRKERRVEVVIEGLVPIAVRQSR